MRRIVPAVAAALLTGCGVPPTGPVEAGAPATGIVTGPRLYFLDGDRLRGVTPAGPVRTPQEALTQLLRGPGGLTRTKHDLKRGTGSGLTTRLGSGLRMRAVIRGGGVTVDLVDYSPETIKGPATGQIVCTMASVHAAARGGSPAEVPVTIRSGSDRAGTYRCTRFLRS